ncbi:MAG: CHAT domain-containing protein [Granulosicoccus sp.]
MTTLIVPGKIDSETQKSDLEKRLSEDFITTRYSVTFQLDRSADAGEDELDVGNSDVVELEMDDGQKLWVRVDELEDEFERAGLERSGAANGTAIRIPGSLPLDNRTRGVGQWVIKGLKVIGIDIAGSISEFVSEKVESKLSPGPGLYQCGSSHASDLQPVGSIDKSKPILVFIHGTASSTDGSFGALWAEGSERIASLLDHYDNQVLAYQHQTLTLSPAENALELLSALNDLQSSAHQEHPLRLHIVTHSRGGLVGEYLCRGTRIVGAAFDDIDINFFVDDVYKRDKAVLQTLGGILDRTDIIVEKFVRVACPARGTTLADGRFDRYLSGLVNVMEKVPGLSNPVFDGVSSLLLAVVHKRTEPEELPGIEAMMPVSPTIRMLNRPDISVKADLHVIGGDVKASGFFNRLKVIITDLFYREDHDLVVNTPSMFGGAPRLQDVRYWVDTGGKVNHFRYFANQDTASRLIASLKGDDAPFHTLEEKPYEVNQDSYRKRTIEPQPILFVLPGIMGSHLSANGDRVWLDFLQIARGRLRKLGIEHSSPEVQAVKPLDEPYGELMKYLASSHDVRAFAYDWRVSIVDTAKLLLNEVEAALDEALAGNQPIRFLAHSMGGLVVRAMLATPEGEALWTRISEHPGARFIMLGTPNGGAHSMATMFIGRHALMRKLALLDFTNSYADLLKIVARFDGALQLLPHNGTLDLYELDSWEQLYSHDVPSSRGVFSSKIATKKSAGISWVIPDAAQLEQAATVRDLIAGSLVDEKRMIYVAGKARATAVDLSINPNARASRQVVVHATAAGDGTVPWQSGIPKGLPERQIYYMDAEHGNMADTHETFPAIRELLENGETRQLSNAPKVSRGGSNEWFVMPDPEPDMYPDRGSLLAAAMGGRLVERTKPIDKCLVRIVHGDLARSRFPVVVGHYKGDTIVSAESYLDRQLDNRLRERHRLGIYPGDSGTSIIMLNWPEEQERKRSSVHPGAVVVGLGTVGELTPGGLTATLVEALMRYTLQVRDTKLKRDRARARSELPGVINAPLTTLLISASNDLNVSDSLRSILRAVKIVNDRLQLLAGENDSADADDDNSGAVKPRVQISELDVIEYWEDRAIQATQSLLTFAEQNDLQQDFQFHRQLDKGESGRRRVSFADEGDWWQRMRITVKKNDALKFETLTERARIESQLQSTQRVLVDKFLARAAASGSYNPSLGKTLFELLTPNELKQYAPDRRDLILMLDDKSAVYPWELLQDGFDSVGKPMAVEAGIVRQLITGKFRANPLMAQSQSALVVGDPVKDIDSDHPFSALPGAVDEARQVQSQLLAAHYDTTTLIGKAASALDVVRALYEKPYRIVHVAAHGVHDLLVDETGRPVREETGKKMKIGWQRRTGVVLGDGIYLTPNEFEQMRNVPELVFINCCHLGKQAEAGGANSVEYHRLAANVGTQLIRMGVRAVIAAGWAVDDDAAKLFAETFYKRFLSDSTFGDAILAARKAAYSLEEHSNGNTWGAYQCYGDPDFKLHAHGYKNTASEPLPLSPSQFQEEMENIVRRVSHDVSKKERDRLAVKLERIIEKAPVEWFASGAICSAAGSAYAELGKLQEAASYYQKARLSSQADVPISSIEQLVNMKARMVVDMLGDSAGLEVTGGVNYSVEELATADSELKEALRIIESLIQLNATQERYCLMGSLHKRLAMLTTEREQQNSVLLEMFNAYDLACELGKKAGEENLFYPLQNRLAARIALSWTSGSRGKAKRTSSSIKVTEQAKLQSDQNPGSSELISDDIADLQGILGATDMRDADFYTQCQEPELLLLKALSNNRVLSLKELPPIENGYKRALNRGSTVRQQKSVGDQLRFFHAVAYTQLSAAERSKTKLCERLNNLFKTLQS